MSNTTEKGKYYVVYNYCELFNIFSTEKRALDAMKLLAQRQGISLSQIDKTARIGFSSILGLDHGLYLFEVEEGEAFGHKFE